MSNVGKEKRRTTWDTPCHSRGFLSSETGIWFWLSRGWLLPENEPIAVLRPAWVILKNDLRDHGRKIVRCTSYPIIEQCTNRQPTLSVFLDNNPEAGFPVFHKHEIAHSGLGQFFDNIGPTTQFFRSGWWKYPGACGLASPATTHETQPNNQHPQKHSSTFYLPS